MAAICCSNLYLLRLMVSISLLLRNQWYPIVAATSAVVEALVGFLKELSFWRFLPPAWPEERAVVFFQCALLIHLVGHIGFWGRRPEGLAIVLQTPGSPA